MQERMTDIKLSYSPYTITVFLGVVIVFLGGYAYFDPDLWGRQRDNDISILYRNMAMSFAVIGGLIATYFLIMIIYKTLIGAHLRISDSGIFSNLGFGWSGYVDWKDIRKVEISGEVGAARTISIFLHGSKTDLINKYGLKINPMNIYLVCIPNNILNELTRLHSKIGYKKGR